MAEDAMASGLPSLKPAIGVQFADHLSHLHDHTTVGCPSVLDQESVRISRQISIELNSGIVLSLAKRFAERLAWLDAAPPVENHRTPSVASATIDAALTAVPSPSFRYLRSTEVNSVFHLSPFCARQVTATRVPCRRPPQKRAPD